MRRNPDPRDGRPTDEELEDGQEEWDRLVGALQELLEYGVENGQVERVKRHAQYGAVTLEPTSLEELAQQAGKQEEYDAIRKMDSANVIIATEAENLGIPVEDYEPEGERR